MIDPRELRIGNLIYNELVVVAADGRTIFDLAYWEKHQYQPIPITPEWLDRLGFEKSGKRQYRINLAQNPNVPMWFIVSIETWIATGDTPFDYYAIYGEFGEIPHARINSIHQLQNLYHALTGQELTAKEKQDVR